MASNQKTLEKRLVLALYAGPDAGPVRNSFASTRLAPQLSAIKSNIACLHGSCKRGSFSAIPYH